MSLKQPIDLKQPRKNSDVQWLVAETPQSLFSEKQKLALLGAIPDNKFLKAETLKAQKEASARKLQTGEKESKADPVMIDWRDKKGNYISQVNDQGHCGSDVSFATVALIEAMAHIELKVELDLSEADCHFSSLHGLNCKGWWPNKALDDAQKRGICDEMNFPYFSAFPDNNPFAPAKDDVNCKISGPPDTTSTRSRTSISNWTTAVFISDRKKHLANIGPMIACFDVYDDFFSYSSGVYHHIYGEKKGMHCVLVIGYSDIEQCWICKNSWGPAWGDGGFFKIKYGECNINNEGTSGTNANPFYGCSGVFRSSNGFQSMGLVSASKLAIGKNLDGRLEVFCRNGGQIWHAWQTAPNNGWSGWTILNATFNHFIGDPVVTSNADGRLEVFCIDEYNKIRHCWQIAPNAGWSDWNILGVYDGQFSGKPAVALNNDGRLEVFVVGIAQRLYHISQVAPNSYWGSWSMVKYNPLINYPKAVGSPAVAKNRDGCLEIFYRNNSGQMVHGKQITPGGAYGMYNFLINYYNLFSTDPYTNNPVVAKNLDGRLEVFCVNIYGQLAHIWQTSVNGTWNNVWAQIYISPPYLIPLWGNISVCNNRDGRIEFVADSNNQIIHTRQQMVNDSTQWDHVEIFDGWGRNPVIASNEDGRLEVFATCNFPNSPFNTIGHTWQLTPNGTWN